MAGEPLTPSSWLQELEPAALATTMASAADKALVSSAISAKRQADALERIARSLASIDGEVAHPEYGIAPTLRKMSFS